MFWNLYYLEFICPLDFILMYICISNSNSNSKHISNSKFERECVYIIVIEKENAYTYFFHFIKNHT